jgi:hypothetical protein
MQIADCRLQIADLNSNLQSAICNLQSGLEVASTWFAGQDRGMQYQAPPRVARINRQELASLPAHWTDRERGQYVRLLLGIQGIDCGRLYWVEYHPRHHCWLVTQPEPLTKAAPESGPLAKDDALCLQILTEFRRTARLAWAALAARSPELARHGGKYELPDRPEELTPAGLVNQLGHSGPADAPVQFDAEGGWHEPTSPN